MAQQIPMSQSDVAGETQDDGTLEVAPDLAYLRLAFVNAVFYGAPGVRSTPSARDWVLVDTGIIGMAGRIRRAAAKRFGADVPPAAIVLTHAHFDHVGTLEELGRAGLCPSLGDALLGWQRVLPAA